jgi:hypothetical protein
MFHSENYIALLPRLRHPGFISVETFINISSAAKADPASIV